MKPEQTLNALIRDATAVGSIPKSKLRTKINDLLDTAYYEGVRAGMDYITNDGLDVIPPRQRS